MIGIGSIILIIGVALAAWQWEAVWMVLRGGVPLLLLTCGVVVFLIGYSRIKARRFYRKNVKEAAPED